MKIQCFERAIFRDGKLHAVPVEVTLTKDTEWSNGAYPYTVKRLNKELGQIGATSRLNSEGFEYYNCAFDPVREIAEAEERQKFPDKFKFPPHFNFFGTAEESFSTIIKHLNDSITETKEELDLLNNRLNSNIAQLEAIHSQIN